MNSILNEYGVLGSLLIDPSLFPEAAELPDDMFSSVPLQEIFRAMRHQYEESGSFDALTVRVEAGRNCTDVTDKLIAGLMDTTPTTANLDVYLAAVKEAALARSLRKIGEELMTAEHDPTDALGRAQEALQRLAEENTRGDSQTLTAVLMQLGYRVSEQVGGRVPCVASGLLRFDKLLGGGFINGGLHVIGARPAVGKSALALQIALNAARNGVKVLYLSLEMSAEDCSARLVGNIGGLSSARLMFGGRLTDNEYTRFAEGTTALSALPLVFNKRTGMNVRQVEALAYREKPGLLILDHLGLLEPPEARLSLYEATTRNSRALKLLALRLNIPVLCLCQLNRAAASDRSGSFRATMANLRESGAIEQDADRPDSRTEHLQRPQRPEEGHAAACQHRAQRTSWTAGRCSWRWPCSAWYRQRRYGVHYLGGDRSCAEILRRQCGRFQSQKGNVRLYRHARINKDPNAQPSGGGAELRRQCACV